MFCWGGAATAAEDAAPAGGGGGGGGGEFRAPERELLLSPATKVTKSAT